jgi:hypothetical protein
MSPVPILTSAQTAAQSYGKQIKSDKLTPWGRASRNIRAERRELRFQSSHGIAATPDANFGIEEALVTYIDLSSGLDFEVPIPNLPQQ